MRVLVFGATGRTGTAVLDQAVKAGHIVTAFVRDPKRLINSPSGISIATGDIYKPETIDAAMLPGFDAIIVVVGADPLKPSTVVTDSARAIVAAAAKAGIPRYPGITGTAEMPRKTILGDRAPQYDVGSGSTQQWCCVVTAPNPFAGNAQIGWGEGDAHFMGIT